MKTLPPNPRLRVVPDATADKSRPEHPLSGASVLPARVERRPLAPPTPIINPLQGAVVIKP